MSTPMLAAAIVLSVAITFGLRALPFLIFSGERKMPDWLQKLLAVLVVAVSYHFKRSTFLSIFLGTAAYMLLLHFFKNGSEFEKHKIKHSKNIKQNARKI